MAWPRVLLLGTAVSFGAGAMMSHPLLDGIPSMGDAVTGPSTSSSGSAAPVGYFLRTLAENVTSETVSLAPGAPSASLAGLRHYRLLPGIFPKGMGYHFDGLATVMKFSFSDDGKSVSVLSKPFASDAYVDYSSCIFYGTGTGPTIGRKICFTNPGVNLLPIDGQLWLTIDTANWGRVDPETLDTLAAKVNVNSLVLNAHPACDRATGECFVQHPCPTTSSPLSDQVCISRLEPSSSSSEDMEGGGDMGVVELSRATLPYKKLIQHSHSPCVTPHYVISKLDAFHGRNPINGHGGLLKFAFQGEDDKWLVMDRRTNTSRVMQSTGAKFVNNHFWNCYEDSTGAVVVQTVPATSDYLDNYFEKNLEVTPNWDKLFQAPLQCSIPPAAQQDDGSENANATGITCFPFLAADTGGTIKYFDYPTFNPLYKMRPDYKFFYAISPAGPASRWFDTLVKVQVASSGDSSSAAAGASIVARWSDPGVYLTEADFIPGAGAGAAEDDGMLLTILYNATSDASSMAFFDAKDLSLLSNSPLEQVVPFHAHGIVCPKGQQCFSNP